MLQWIGIALTIVGLAFNGYKQFHTTQPVQNQQQVQRFQYTTINIAYDHATGKHFFQHPDGQWYGFPPRP
jgi:hypothetical protein